MLSLLPYATSRRSGLAAALSVVACLGCESATGSSEAGLGQLDAGGHEVLIGQVEDSDVRVGALADGARIRVFLCGGPSSYASATHWLRAELDRDGRFRAESDVLELSGSIADGVLEAERVLDGERTVVRAERVRAGTLAGLYEAKAECGTVGLIVAHDEPDADPVAQGACVGGGHLPDQVNPIEPIARDRSGSIAVEVVRDGAAEPVRVSPATL